MIYSHRKESKTNKAKEDAFYVLSKKDMAVNF